MSKVTHEFGSIKVTPNKQLRVASLNVLNSPVMADIRFKRLKEEINKLQPDVLMLQECNFNQNADLIESIKKDCGFKSMHKSIDIQSRHENITSAMVTLVKADNSISYELPLIQTEGVPAYIIEPTLVNRTIIGDSPVFTFNVHLAWGSDNEALRLNQVMQIEDEILKLKKENNNAVFIMGGDFNATDKGSVFNFMTKQHIHEGRGTLWLDPWEMFGNEGNRITSNGNDLFSMQTALDTGVTIPQLSPNRRIDFILVKDWAYGRHGSPLSFMRWADTTYEDGYTISDHYGVLADFYIHN
jgi:endonuclease/exonuclease/phosphatase family metal-dependent hydrolase